MIFNINQYIKSRSISQDFFVLYRLVLGLLALLHAVWFVKMGYPVYVYFDQYISIPIFEIFNLIPNKLHTIIYLMMFLSSAGIIFNRYLRLSLSYTVFVLLYSEFHNYFAFHQDIFLGAAIYFFSIFIYNKEGDKILTSYAMYAIQATIVILYFSAGINKFNEEFLSGYVIANILETSLIWNELLGEHIHNENMMLILGQFACYFSFIVELLFPILILFKRTRNFAVILGLLLHLGIDTTGRGMLFNLYIPAMYLLWFTALKFPEIIINKDGIKFNNVQNKFLFTLSLPLILLYFFHLAVLSIGIIRLALKVVL